MKFSFPVPCKKDPRASAREPPLLPLWSLSISFWTAKIKRYNIHINVITKYKYKYCNRRILQVTKWPLTIDHENDYNSDFIEFIENMCFSKRVNLTVGNFKDYFVRSTCMVLSIVFHSPVKVSSASINVAIFSLTKASGPVALLDSSRFKNSKPSFNWSNLKNKY